MFSSIAKVAAPVCLVLALCGCAAGGASSAGSGGSSPAGPTSTDTPSIGATSPGAPTGSASGLAGSSGSSSAVAADPHQAGAFELKVGDCLNDVDSLMVTDVPLVDCAAPHDLEVFDDFEVTDPSWNPVALSTEADDGCTTRFATFIGIAYDDSTLDVTSYKPTALSWGSGDRLISCLVGDSGGKTIGSLRGAAR